METSNVQPMIEPDPEQMRRHVAHLFDGCHEGRIELAWTDGRDGRLRHAAIFGTDVPSATEELAPIDSSPRASLQIGSTHVSVEGCLAHARAGDHWHDNLVRLTGHWIARGWSDAEILTAAEALTLPGYTIAQTRREVGAKTKRRQAENKLPHPPYARRRGCAAARASDLDQHTGVAP
jgi:hypothetical protein